MIAGTVWLLAGQPALVADIWWKPAQGSIKIMRAAVVESLLVRIFASLSACFSVSCQFVQLTVQLPIRNHPPQAFPEVQEEIQDEPCGNHRDHRD